MQVYQDLRGFRSFMREFRTKRRDAARCNQIPKMYLVFDGRVVDAKFLEIDRISSAISVPKSKRVGFGTAPRRYMYTDTDTRTEEAQRKTVQNLFYLRIYHVEILVS